MGRIEGVEKIIGRDKRRSSLVQKTEITVSGGYTIK